MTRFPIHHIACIVCTLLVAAGLLVIPAPALELSSSGSAGSQAISNGDYVTLNGVATGHPRNGLQVWVIGKNYLRIDTVNVNADNSFTYELKPADTQNLASGQYYVVVQHPMMNGQFDIYYESSTGRVVNRQQGSGGMSVYQMSGSGSLQGPDSAQALINAISSQDVDDMFTTYTFSIEPPAAFIDPIGDHAVGDRFTITGSTNLAVGDDLLVEITSSSFKPTSKSSPSGFSGASGMVKVVPGTKGYNLWSFDVDSSSFTPDEYLVKVAGVTVDVTGSTTFNVVERLPATATAVPVITAAAAPQNPAGTVAVQSPAAQSPAPTRKSPFIPALAVLACAAVLMGRQFRN